MSRAAERPRRAERLLGVVAAMLVFSVHAVLEPAHLVMQHGQPDARAHADQQVAVGHGPADHEHDHEHEDGDHSGAGHLLEAAPTAPAAPAPPLLAAAWLPQAEARGARNAGAADRPAVAAGRGDSLARGPSASRAPPLG